MSILFIYSTYLEVYLYINKFTVIISQMYIHSVVQGIFIHSVYICY